MIWPVIIPANGPRRSAEFPIVGIPASFLLIYDGNLVLIRIFLLTLQVAMCEVSLCP
jgi:hypothetical protein